MSPEDITQCEHVLHRMRNIANHFYMQAVLLGHHPFIEFTGLMNEYIGVCEKALENGIDFRECSTHTGKALPVESYQLAYINEKLECVFNGLIAMRDKNHAHAQGTEQAAR